MLYIKHCAIHISPAKPSSTSMHMGSEVNGIPEQSKRQRELPEHSDGHATGT